VSKQEKWQKFARELGKNRQLSWEPGEKREEYTKMLTCFKHLQQEEFTDLRKMARKLGSKQDVPYKMLLVGLAALICKSFRGRSMLILHDPAQIRQTVYAIAEALADKSPTGTRSANWFQMDQAAIANVLWTITFLYPLAQRKWWKKNKKKLRGNHPDA
jgi:hypothetical protein